MGHILKGQVRYTLAVEDVIQQGEIPTDLQGISPLAFTSGVSASFDENIDADSTVYTVAAEKPDGTTTGITYGISGTDAGDFTINANTGVITIDASPNFEADPSYSIIVTANHANFDAITRNVALAVNNLDDTVPTITSGATATAIAENSGAGQVIYTVTADDSSDVSGGVTFALASTAPDNSAFTINATTGEVTLTANPDYETKSSYIFAVQATDAVGNQSSVQGVSLTITNVVDVAPSFTSSTVTASAVAENASGTPPSTSIYDFDTNINNPDGALFTLSVLTANPSSGGNWSIDSGNILRHSTAFDYEANTSYTVIISMSYTLGDGTSGSTNMQLTVPISDDTSDNAIEHTITHLSQCVAGSSTPYTEANGFCLYGAHWTGSMSAGSYRGGSSVSPDHNSIWGSVGANNVNMIQDLGFVNSNYGGYSANQPYRHKAQVLIAGGQSNNPTNWSVTMNPGVSQTFNRDDADVNTVQSNGKRYYEWYLGAAIPGSGTAWHAAKNFTNGNTWTASFTIL